MRGSGLLGAEVGFLIFATCFSMRSCLWRQISGVLYLCTCGTVGFSFEFRRTAGGIGFMSSGMMWGARCGGRLGDCPGWKYMTPCRSTLECGTGAADVVAYGVFTLGGGLGGFFCFGLSFVGGFTCGGEAMLNI